MMETIKAGPFPIHFTNVNKEMKLAGHSHLAEVFLEYITMGSFGFPSFEDTHAEIQQQFIKLTEKPFMNHTNEAIARLIFNTFLTFRGPAMIKWGGHYRLHAIELHVRGIPDKIGHANGFTQYRIENDRNEYHLINSDTKRESPDNHDHH